MLFHKGKHPLHIRKHKLRDNRFADIVCRALCHFSWAVAVVAAGVGVFAFGYAYALLQIHLVPAVAAEQKPGKEVYFL